MEHRTEEDLLQLTQVLYLWYSTKSETGQDCCLVIMSYCMYKCLLYVILLDQTKQSERRSVITAQI